MLFQKPSFRLLPPFELGLSKEGTTCLRASQQMESMSTMENTHNRGTLGWQTMLHRVSSLRALLATTGMIIFRHVCSMDAWLQAHTHTQIDSVLIPALMRCVFYFLQRWRTQVRAYQFWGQQRSRDVLVKYCTQSWHYFHKWGHLHRMQ